MNIKKHLIRLSSIILFAFAMQFSLFTNQANSAAIKNGVSCTKFGQTIKVGTKSYKCAKNPYASPRRNTWTLRGCLTALSMWRDAKNQYEDFVDIAKLAGSDGEKTMQELQNSITELELTMQNSVCKKGA